LLISTIYKLPQHPLSLFPACCVLNSLSLVTASNGGDSSASRPRIVTVRQISRNWTPVNSTIAPSLLSLPWKAQLNCQPPTNWVPGWRPFHTNLLVFSSQAEFQLTTELSHSPTSYFTSLHSAKVKVKVTLRLAVYRQSVHLGVKPLETHDQTFFQLNSCGNSSYVTSSLTRRWACLLWICLAFCQVYKLRFQPLEHINDRSTEQCDLRCRAYNYKFTVIVKLKTFHNIRRPDSSVSGLYNIDDD
jgi:hypothetical protein